MLCVAGCKCCLPFADRAGAAPFRTSNDFPCRERGMGGGRGGGSVFGCVYSEGTGPATSNALNSLSKQYHLCC